MHQGLSATTSLETRIANMLDADRKHREVSILALHHELEKCKQIRTPDLPEASTQQDILEHPPTNFVKPHHKTPSGVSIDPKASDEDVAQTKWSTSEEHAPESPLELVQSPSASHARCVTYGKINRSKSASIGAGEPLPSEIEPIAKKPPRKRQRARASSSRKRKRAPPKLKIAEISQPHTPLLDETGAFAIPVPEQRPRPRKSDSRKRFESSIFSIPSRFPPSRAAKKPDTVYIHPN